MADPIVPGEEDDTAYSFLLTKPYITVLKARTRRTDGTQGTPDTLREWWRALREYRLLAGDIAQGRKLLGTDPSPAAFCREASRVAAYYPNLHMYPPSLHISAEHVLNAITGSMAEAWELGAECAAITASNDPQVSGPRVWAEVREVQHPKGYYLDSGYNLHHVPPAERAAQLGRWLWARNGLQPPSEKSVAVVLTIWPGASLQNARDALDDAWKMVKVLPAPGRTAGVRAGIENTVQLHEKWLTWCESNPANKEAFLNNLAVADDGRRTNAGKLREAIKWLLREA